MDDYAPDLVYFDEGPLPMSYAECRASPLYGLSLYAHFYNATLARRGRNDAVITAKLLDPAQRRALVYDIERGKAPGILPQPWQTDTCLGDWHYSRALFEQHRYKTAATVIPMLADIVSRNGNLLLSVPMRADGTIDSDESKIVGEIGAWLRVNGEAIYGTRPWIKFGEGPSAAAAQERGAFDGVKDVAPGILTSADLRFTQSKDGSHLYVLALGWPPDGRLYVKSLARSKASIQDVSLLGSSASLNWNQTPDGLVVKLPAGRPCDYVYVLKISGIDPWRPESAPE
jgi:alpha-L-fucosidase